MTKQIPPNEKTREREVSRIVVFVFAAALIALIAGTIMITLAGWWTETLKQGMFQIWLFYPLFPAIAIWLNRRRRSLAALATILGGMVLGMFLTDLRISGYGLLFAAGFVLITLFVSLQTRLPGRQGGLFIFGAVALGTGVWLLDVYGNPARPPEAPQFLQLVGIVLGLLALILAIFALRRWRQFSLRTKLSLGFIAVSLITVVAVTAIASVTVANSLTNQVGKDLHSLAVNKAALVASAIDREEELVLQLSASDLLRGAAVTANRKYPQDSAQLDAYMRDLNRQWKVGASDTLQFVLSNPSAVQLTRFRDDFENNLQILLLDKYGGLVAATNPPDDYDQRAKDWWVQSTGSLTSRAFISQPTYSPELNRVGVIFTAPIHDPATQEVVGLIQAVYNIDGFTQELAVSLPGKTGSSDILFPSGQFLRPSAYSGSSSAGPVFQFINAEDNIALAQLDKVDYARINYGGRAAFASKAPVLLDTTGGANEINLGWSVIVDQSPTEALAAVGDTGQAAVLTGVGAILLAGLLALLAAQFLTVSITRLTLAAETVSEGNLTVQAPVDSEDEIGALATTFNRMTGRLRQTLETLELRVAERTADLSRSSQELEHRATNLQASAEIARAIASTLKLEELLPLVTRLIGERFGFSHVAVYLLDEKGENALLQAAFSALGQAQLDPGEKVEVGSRTFVGFATGQREMRLSQDVSWDSLFPKSPRLIGTRSELTLPLFAAGELIGALDIHSPRTGGFAEADMSVLTGLGDQITIAIQNARSFERQVALVEENRRSLVIQTTLAEENRRTAERASALAEESRRSAERAEALAEENRLAAERQTALATENRGLLERAQVAVEELNSLTRRLTGEGWNQYLAALTGGMLVEDAMPGLMTHSHHDQQSPVTDNGDAPVPGVQNVPGDPSHLPALMDRAVETGGMVTARNGRSTVAVPILLRGEVIGSVALEDVDPQRAWNADEVALAEQVSDRLAIALDNARLYSESQRELQERKRYEEQIRRQNAYLSALANTTVALIQRLDPQELVTNILTRASELVGTQNGYVYLVERETNQLKMSIGTGVYAHRIGQYTERGTGLAGTVFETGEPLVIDDYQAWPQRLRTGGRSDIRAVTGVPLKSGDEVIGVLGLAHTLEGRKFDPAEIDILQRLAQLASIALDNARLYTAAQTELEERKRTEQELRRTEQFLDSVIENLPVALFTKDARDLKYLRWNKAEEEMIGRSRDQIIGKTPYDLYPQEQADMFVAQDREVLKSKVLLDIPEEKSYSQTKGYRYMHTRIVPILDDQGEPRYLIGISEDITEQRQAQETIRQQNAYLTALYETSIGLIQRLDPRELLQALLTRAGEILDVGHGFVYLADPAQKDFVVAATLGSFSELLGARMNPQEGITWQVTQTGQSAVINDYLHWEHRSSVSLAASFHSLVGVPLKSGDEVIGILGLGHRVEGRTFSPEQVQVLERFAQLGAIALDNARLYNAAQQELAERKRTEEALTAERTLVNLLLDNVPDAIFFKDPEGRFMRGNRALAGRYGFDDPQEMVGKSDFDLFTEEHARPAYEDELEIMRSGQPIVGKEERETLKGGVVRWASTTKLPLRDATGQVIGTAGISRDITQGKLAEQSLRDSEERFRALVDSAQDAIVAADGRGAIISWNRGAERLFGYSIEEVQGISATRLFVADVSAFFGTPEERERLLAQGGSGSMLQTVVRRKDRRTIPIEMSLTTWQTSQGQFYTAIIRDITERQRMEQAIRESEAFYHNLVELLPENLCMKDQEGRFVFVNQRYCQDMGRTREEIIGKTDYDLHPQELADGYRADDLRVIETGETIDAIEEHQPLDGPKTYVHTVKSPTRDANGKVTGVQIIFWDVTEQMRTQERLRQQNEYFGAMHEMSLAMIGRHDVGELLTDIVGHASALVGSEHGYVYLYDPLNDQIEMRVGLGIYQEFVGSNARRGQGLAGTVWERGEPIRVEDYRQWPGRLPHPSRDKLRAVVGVPLQSGDQTVGVMGFAYLEEGRQFGPNEIDVLNRFAQLAAIALDNAKLFQDSQQRLNELGALNRISQALTSQLDFNTLTFTIGEHLREIFDVQSVYLAMHDRTRNLIEFPYFLSEGKLMPVEAIPFGEGLTSRIIQTREPLFLNEDIDRHATQLHARVMGSPAQSYLGVPILVGQEAIGVVSIQSVRRTNVFTENDLRLLTTIAASVGVAIQNARLFKEAQERAQREFLTREIVARVSRSIDQKTILQTTARQLGHALGSSHVVIRIVRSPGEGQSTPQGDSAVTDNGDAPVPDVQTAPIQVPGGDQSNQAGEGEQA
ncbi:MAG: GAF domain-containing protein [Anaerolineae bacterium]